MLLDYGAEPLTIPPNHKKDRSLTTPAFFHRTKNV